MSLFRREQRSSIESELREARPQPPADLVEGIASRIEPLRPARVRGQLRIGVAVAATAALVGSTAAFGGYGVATSSASHAVKAVEHVVVTKKTEKPKAPQPSRSVSAAKREYHKVKMCHDKHITIEVAQDDVPAHLAAGDTLGKCEKRHHEKHHEKKHHDDNQDGHNS